MKAKEFENKWKHFCNCVNFAQSAMDADAIRFMNEGPNEITKSLKALEFVNKYLMKIRRQKGIAHHEYLIKGIEDILTTR